MATSEFHGSITALITPFADGKLDEKRYQDFVAWQIDQGTHGIVASATTGEAPTLSDEESGLISASSKEPARKWIPP